MSEISTLSRSVQELVENGDKVPNRYIWRDRAANNSGPVDLSVPLATEIPVIDVIQLASAMDAELLKLRSALSSWGCFQAINHGIEDSLLDEVRKLAGEFFHLPMAEKQTYARLGDDIEGYGNDIVLFENQSLDWNDRLYLVVRPEDRRKLKYWPQSPPSFRAILNEYTTKSKQIHDQLLKSMARSLSLPEDRFLNKCGERGTTYARFNYYPPCSRPELVLGLKPHADGSTITILLQDEQVRGLQLLRDNQWFWVPIMPHALFVNAGDQLEIMSNGIFKSPIHRAVANSDKERKTLAMFCCPDLTEEIEPMDELVDDQRPRLFKTVMNYPETYFHYYQQGKRPIDAVRI